MSSPGKAFEREHQSAMAARRGALLWLAVAVAAAGALATLAFMAIAAGPKSHPWGWWLGTLPFVGWMLAPFLVAGLAAHRAAGGAAVLLATLVICGGAVLLYADVTLWHPDAQGAIAFVTVPFLQLVLCAAFFALRRGLSRLRGVARADAL